MRFTGFSWRRASATCGSPTLPAGSSSSSACSSRRTSVPPRA